MKELIQRNMPVFVIGGVTLLVFVVIIFVSQVRPAAVGPQLEKINEGDLIASYSPVEGNPNAKVVLVEFSDFECPACKAFHPLVARLFEQNREFMKVVYRHYPLPQHTLARKAAEASMIAADEGKFWEYATKLFDNQPNLSRDELIKYAGEIGMDTAKFTAALDGAKYTTIVNEDVKAGQSLGINATPTFFLNGQKLVFNTFDEFNSEVLAAVAAVKPKADTGNNQSTASAEKPANLEITFDGKGFKPSAANGVSGQLVVWRNASTQDLVLQQTTPMFPELSVDNIVKPGGTFEFRLYKEKTWTYKDKSTGTAGSIYIAPKP